jgi:DNA-directed RNA polymerase subunit N
MLPPVVCFSCGKTISHLYEQFTKKVEETKGKIDTKKLLDDLGLHRICCRTVVLSTVDISEDLPYV